MTNTSLIAERARYYGRQIQKTGRFLVHHAAAGHPELRKMDFSRRPDLDMSKIQINERPTGYHNVLVVGGEWSPLCLVGLQGCFVLQLVSLNQLLKI